MKLPKLNITDRFMKLTTSDQRAVIVLAAFLSVILLYLATNWSFNYRKTSISELENNRSMLALLHMSEQKLKAVKRQNKVADQNQPLLTLVSSTAKENNIVFKRFQPDGDNALRLWMENVNFNSLLLWLHGIDKKNGISVQEISVDQAKEEGFVDVRLTLKR